LDRLQQHRRHGVVQRRLERAEIPEGYVPESFRHRLERLVLCRLAGSGESRQRATVEAAERADDDMAPAPAELARQLDRCFVRLSS